MSGLKSIIKILALAAVLYLLVSMPPVTHAQFRNDLVIRSVHLLQVVSDPLWIVAGKPAALEVEIFSTFSVQVSVPIAVTYNFGNSTYVERGPYGEGVMLNPGRNTVYLTGGPVPSSGEEPWITGSPYLVWDVNGVDSEIEVTIDPDQTIDDVNPENNKLVIEKEVVTPNPFKVLFSPVVLGGDDDFGITNAAMERQRTFMLNTYPLASLTFDKRPLLRLDDITAFERSTAYDDFVFTLSSEADLLGYDRIAIVINTPTFGYCGVALQILHTPVDRMPVILTRGCVEQSSKESLTAHEIGHTFYLWHPHCEWFNDLPVYSDLEYSVTEREYDVLHNTMMSYEPSPHWIDRYRYQEYPKTWFDTPPQFQEADTVAGSYQWNLLEQFKPKNLLSVLLIKARMFKAGALEILPWYRMVGIPDFQPGSFTPGTDMSVQSEGAQSDDSRRYLNLIMLNSSQQQVALYPFVVTFTKLIQPDFDGEWIAVESDIVPFYFKVPFFDDVSMIQIADETGNILGQRTVSSHAPEVEVLDPNGGEYISAESPYTICWSAVDQDEDMMKYSLSFSPDGGQGWIPIVSEIEDTCYQWDTSRLDNGYYYLVKVIATDGLNTGEDSSDRTFFVEAVDSDSDHISNINDNCPNDYNPNQEDSYPPHGNDIGDACDCESDFNCDGNVDATDVTSFLVDFGRSTFFNPCTNSDSCNGDVDCNGNVDAADVNKFLEDFGRSQFFNPCPACVAGNWCVY
jgi:hypothetical protein